METINRGEDLEILCSNSSALDAVEGYAIHIRQHESSVEIAKYSNNVVDGYDQRLEDVSLATTPATFLLKIPRTLTATMKAGKRYDAILYTQTTNTGYPENDFRPSSGWELLGVASMELFETTDIS